MYKNFNIISLLLILIIIVYCSKKWGYSNRNNINLFYKSFDYNIYYENILYESYSKTPNITKELWCIACYYKNESISTFFVIDGIRLYAKSARMTNLIAGLKNNDGDIGTHYYQMQHYNMLIRKKDEFKRIKNICEVGFQLGVGAITLITSVKHDVDYYGFDLGRKHSKNLYTIISSIFSLNMIWGNSNNTIRNFYSKNKAFSKCDVIHIDACHSQEAIYSDIINMRRISKYKSLLLLDDVDINSKSIVKAKKNKLITNIDCFKWKPYCVAEYI